MEEGRGDEGEERCKRGRSYLLHIMGNFRFQLKYSLKDFHWLKLSGCGLLIKCIWLIN